MINEELKVAARKIEIPEWATHVAVRNDGSKAEPAAWVDECNDYVDEDPSDLPNMTWIGLYKSYYWTFIDRNEL